MRVLSLFDGMSCGQIALRDMGITPEVYYASEVDKFAIAQTQLNFPDTIQLGDVRHVDVKNLIGGGKIDLLIGGSPCQSFSFAGKRVGMATKENEKILTLERYLELKEQGFEFEGQSYLFWEYMRILTELRKLNPNIKFLLENVKMKKEWEQVLTDAIGVPGVHINSALVSAQNRKRIYWTNIGEIEQPEDRGLLLRDVLQTEVDEKYFLKEEIARKLGTALANRHVEKNLTPTDEKAQCFLATSWKGAWANGMTLVEESPLKISRKGEVRKDQDKASCLTVGGHGCGNHSDMDLICVAMRGRDPENPSNRTTGAPTEQRLEPCSSEGKTNCLTTVAKDNLLLQRGRGFNKGGIHTEKAPTLSSNSWEQNNLIVSSEPRIRRLTPTECARLQTIPEWYKWECSETQQYKMLGNGWTVEVIKHIFSYL